MKKVLILLSVTLLGLGLWWLGRRGREATQKTKEKMKPTVVVEEKGGEEKMDLTGKKVLMILAPRNFRDEEALEPKKILEGRGAEVLIASKGVDQAQGMLGASLDVDQDISEVNPQDFNAVIFVGGTGASVYFNDEKAQSLAKSFYQQGKIVSAICIAPSILANAGVLEGKKATSFPSEKQNLESKGAIYTGEEVTVEDKVITAKRPEDASEFGETIALKLAKGG